MCPYGSLLVVIGSYKSLWVLMVPNGFLWVLIASFDCNFILTILQILVGFNQPISTQRIKKIRNDLYLSTVRILSRKIIFQSAIFMNNSRQSSVAQINVFHHFKSKRFLIAVQLTNKNQVFVNIFLTTMQKFCKRIYIDRHQLTNSRSPSSDNNFLANSNIILTIRHVLVGFNRPSTTQ